MVMKLRFPKSHSPIKLSLTSEIDVAYWYHSCLWRLQRWSWLRTPHCNDDLKKIIEPANPMINSSKWMVVHVKWPKWKSHTEPFFNWNTISDFHRVTACFLECLLRSLQKTSNITHMKIRNFAPIKSGLSMWFLFRPLYMYNHPFTWIYH